jgi:hypothetical protein
VIEDQGYGDDRDDREQLCHIGSPSGTGGLCRSASGKRSNLVAEVTIGKEIAMAIWPIPVSSMATSIR